MYDEPQPVSVAFISEAGAAASSRPLARRGGSAATTSEAIHGYPSGAVRVNSTVRHPASLRYGRRCCGLRCGGAREWYGVAATTQAGAGECVGDAGFVPAVCPGRGSARQPAQRSQGAVCTGATGGATTTGPDATHPPTIFQNPGGGGWGGGSHTRTRPSRPPVTGASVELKRDGTGTFARRAPGACPARHLCIKYPGSSPKFILTLGSPPSRPH